MRAFLIAAVVVVAALAGCSSKKGDDHLHYTCPDGTELHADDYEGVLDNITVDFLKTKCPKTSGTSSASNTTSQAPNQLPVLLLTVTDTAGAATNVTLVNGNLTFDATGSNDPDGQVSAIAISVQDSNTTRTKSLYDFAKKTFTPATFTFDRAGVVNVSVAMVDDRAGFTSLATFAYVNSMQTLVAGEIHGPVSAAPFVTDACLGASGELGAQGPIVDAPYFKRSDVTIANGASFIEVTPDSGSLVTICAPDGTAISATKQSAATTSTNTEPLTVMKATENYYVAFYASAPSTDAGATAIVHYEPRPAA